ncbi:succinylglutamate desuccinylase/aspartoacylase family protein [Craterilacuibacter sp. RT1T]|uniref:succinylglutamate desuccinylase/aspartoacylase domain-containing protein n=1 Tax=Craterilacuibacter sp. RT1T TaxID=2942211 RepID=UPI0024BECBB7|nr:succinylglutamate desuccinylase/aspartoacylase family protein [Craterilacuibacter sp. RT1T]
MPIPLQFSSYQFASPQTGPRLIVLGAVHGNEVCGTLGIRRLLAEFESGARVLKQGCVTLVPVTNPLAYNKGERSGDRNLNRNFAPTTTPLEFEDRIANWLCPLLAQHDVLLDLHSFQSKGQAFVFMGPHDNAGTLEPFMHAAKEEALARCLGVSRAVDGWLSTYALGVKRRVALFGEADSRQMQLNTDPCYGMGTTEWMRRCGGWALTLECGQHQDPAAPDVAYQAILNTLAHLGLIDAPAPAPVDGMEALSLYEVIDRMHADDQFVREWVSFDEVKKGEQIATRADGTPVLAVDDGRIVFPNVKSQVGQEWFYLARESGRLG